MIRMVQRKLIIPRGDTGTFSIPVLPSTNTENVAVFTIFNLLDKTKIFQKIVQPSGKEIVINFTHGDTVNLPVGNYVWDIKFYQNPIIVDNELIDGEEVNSYYAAFSLPACEIRQTGDNLLISDESPTATLSPDSINLLEIAIAQTEANVQHYPKIIDGEWYTWDESLQEFVSTGVLADYLRNEDIQPISIEELNTIIGGE